MSVISIDPGSKYVGIAVHNNGVQQWVGTVSPTELPATLDRLFSEHDIRVALIEEPASGLWSDRETYHVFRKAVELLQCYSLRELHQIRPGEWKPFARAQGWHRVGWRKARGLVDQHQHDAAMLYEWWRQASV